MRSDQQAVEADGDMISSFNSESHCAAFNPVVTVVLSSRLLISEGKRAAGINQQAVLNAVIAQMQSPPQPIYAYHARNIVPSLLSPHFDAMSEDGAAAHRNAFEPTHQKNKTQVKTKTMPDESALMGQRRHVSVSPAALEARSISSLPTRIIYHNKIPRRTV